MKTADEQAIEINSAIASGYFEPFDGHEKVPLMELEDFVLKRTEILLGETLLVEAVDEVSQRGLALGLRRALRRRGDFT